MAILMYQKFCLKNGFLMAVHASVQGYGNNRLCIALLFVPSTGIYIENILMLAVLCFPEEHLVMICSVSSGKIKSFDDKVARIFG